MKRKLKKIIAWVVLITVTSTFLIGFYIYSMPAFLGLCAAIGIIAIGWSIHVIDPLGFDINEGD